jgi:hypothetical protein
MAECNGGPEVRVDLLESFLHKTSDIDHLAFVLETICYDGDNIIEGDFLLDLKGMRNELQRIQCTEFELVEGYVSSRSADVLVELATMRAQIYAQMILKYSDRIKRMLTPVQAPPGDQFVRHDSNLFQNADRRMEIERAYRGLLDSFNQFATEFVALAREYPAPRLLEVKKTLLAYEVPKG